jgi:hypothetical protein
MEKADNFPCLSAEDLGLIDPENRRRLDLREPSPLDLRDDLCGQLGFRHQIICLWKVQVRKYVPGTRCRFSIGHLHSLPGHLASKLEPPPDQI